MPHKVCLTLALLLDFLSTATRWQRQRIIVSRMRESKPATLSAIP